MKSKETLRDDSDQARAIADETANKAPAENAAPASDPLSALQSKVDRLEESLLRAKADFQNLQRRAAAEQADAVRYGNAELMKSLVKVADDFERSLEAAAKPENLPAVVEGVRLVYENLRKALFDHGLEPIEALRRPFDPKFHEALLHQPSEEHPPGTVIEQIAKGYRLRDRVIRPAKVVVSKAVEPVAAGTVESAEGEAG